MLCMRILAFCLASSLLACPLSARDDLAERIDRYMQERVARDHFAGSVLVARDGQVLFQQGYGLANREWNAVNSPDTRFRIASTTKQFTAAAILLLQEKRLISVHEPAVRYLPDLPAAWRAVTVHQLLLHTSGIPNYTPQSETTRLDVLGTSPQGLLNLVKDMPLEFEAGTKRLYSNTNYALLGMIIERVSSLSYADFVDRFLLAPLGLKNTGFDWPDRITLRRAVPYRWDADGWKNVQQEAATVLYSAGGLYSTVGDLFLWEEALHDDRLLSAASRGAMFTPYPETTDGSQSEGYGLILAMDGKQPVQIATGNATGYSSAVFYYPESKTSVVVLSNSHRAAVVPVASSLAGFVLSR
jgi:CubicO group peptidase (beta-lactamase class C family)